MIITLPRDWVAPDEQTGALPTIPVGSTVNTWIEIVNYWSALGYFMLPGAGNTIELDFLEVGALQEKNEYMPVSWWEALCDLNNTPYGEVVGWQSVIQVHPDVYAAGLVPLPIPNSTYVNEADQTIQRVWNQWGSPSHNHYYLPAGTVSAQDLTSDRYFIPTWSWGTDILGSEMMWAQNDSGVNIVSRRDWQQSLNAEELQIIAVQPSPA